MTFSQTQIRKLAGKLPERFVKTRNQRGVALSYVEGWHVIDEANRVFGFDGWDRETIWSECVWQDGRQEPKSLHLLRAGAHPGEGRENLGLA